MYYSEIDLKSSLNCPLCNEVFHEPKILECGDSICNECAEQLIKNAATNKEFKCKLCNANHQIPKDGFLVNKHLVKILSLQPKEISRGDLIKKLKNELNTIEDKLKKLDFSIKNGVDVIKEHCIELRRLSQLATETTIQEITKLNDEIIKQINDYESERIKAFNSNADKISSETSKINEHLKAYELDLKRTKEYLTQTSINDQSTVTFLNNLNDLDLAISINDQKLKRSIFNDYLIEFKQNKLAELFGLKSLSSVINLSDLEKSELDFDSNANSISTRFFDNGNQVLAYVTNSNFYLAVYDTNKKLIRKKKISKINESNGYLIYVTRNHIIVHLECVENADIFIDDYLNDLTYQRNKILFVYDSDLIRINSTNKFKSDIAHVNDEHLIFRKSDEEPSCYLFYNYDLDYVKHISFQSTNPQQSFYFPENITFIFYENKRFYVYFTTIDEQNKMRIISETDGAHIKEIAINSDSNLIKVDKFGSFIIVEPNGVEFDLKYFDENGNLNKTIELSFPDFFHSDYELQFNKRGEIHLLDINEKTIYYQKSSLF